MVFMSLQLLLFKVMQSPGYLHLVLLLRPLSCKPSCPYGDYYSIEWGEYITFEEIQSVYNFNDAAWYANEEHVGGEGREEDCVPADDRTVVGLDGV